MAVKGWSVLARLDPADAGLQLTQAEAQRALAAGDLARYRDLKAKNYISASALDARERRSRRPRHRPLWRRIRRPTQRWVADKSGVIGQVLAEPGRW